MSLCGHPVFKDVSFGKGNRACSMLFHQGKKCCVSTEQRREESSAHGCHSRPFHPLPDPHPERYGLGGLCDPFSLLRELASRAPSSSSRLARHPQSGQALEPWSQAPAEGRGPAPPAQRGGGLQPRGEFSVSVRCPLAGSEIDCADKFGNTPLHVAARYGHELLISTLMTNGADTAR